MKFVGGNHLTLLRNGKEYFPSLVDAIDSASTEVFLQTYIFAEDKTGIGVANALARAATRGVSVWLLLDGFGAHTFTLRFRRTLESAGVEVLVFGPRISPWTLRRGRLRRMHRKLTCVDGCVAFVGGINVIDDYDTPTTRSPRYDYAVRIEGPLSREVRAAAMRLWQRVFWVTFRRRSPGLRVPAHPKVATEPVASGAMSDNQHAALVMRDSVRHRRDIEKGYLEHIDGAHEEVLIACAYFLPGRSFRRALIAAVARGTRVVLLLQAHDEYALLQYGSRALYGALLDAGIEIREYHRGFLHAKVAVFDRRFACVGSSNIDPFSMLLALEANLFVDDRAFAEKLRENLQEAMSVGSNPVPPDQWKRRPLGVRAQMWIAYAVVRLLAGLSGYERTN